MKTVFSILLLVITTAAFAHPNGTYVINGDKEVTLTIKRLDKCASTAGALTGYLRSFVFSEKAAAHPYAFVTGQYVEIHEGAKEIYVQTNSSCVPTIDGKRYEASHESFDVYTLEKLN